MSVTELNMRWAAQGPSTSFLPEKPMDLKLQGRRALVNGSTAGIVRAIAASLARVARASS